LVWVVAIAGKVRPPTAPDRTYTWGVFVLDSTTGDFLFMNANSVGSWPQFFDALRDHAP
jgi:hypothetical protein